MEQTSKVIQKRIYDFVSTRFGQTIVVIGAFAILWQFVAIISVVVNAVTDGPISGPGCVHCCKNDYADNLAGTSFEHRLCLEPIDIVYTWVNGDDERLKAQLALYKPVDPSTTSSATATTGNATVTELLEALAAGATGGSANGTVMEKKPDGDTQDHDSQNRYRDNSELRFSLRSIVKFAPWVRHIYIVTNGQVPWWLNVNHPRLTVVPHHDIWVNKSHLPVFASPAIETHLHRIPGLANKFIYFNDDVMLGNEVWPDDFYTHANGQKVYLSWNVPQCSSGCPDTWVGDGYCDQACNITDCLFDGGDCLNATGDTRYNSWSGSRDSSWSSGGSSGQGNRYCASGCPNNWVGDKVCDRSCKNVECAFDGGDCGYELIAESAIPAVELTPSMSVTTLPYGAHAFYMNLSALFPGRIIEASHNNPTFVRSAIVTQQISAPERRINLLTVLLFDDTAAIPAAVTDANGTVITPAGGAPLVEFFVVGSDTESQSPSHNITFEITRSQIQPVQNGTATPVASTKKGVDPAEMFQRLNRGETFPTTTTTTTTSTPAAAATTTTPATTTIPSADTTTTTSTPTPAAATPAAPAAAAAATEATNTVVAAVDAQAAAAAAAAEIVDNMNAQVSDSTSITPAASAIETPTPAAAASEKKTTAKKVKVKTTPPPSSSTPLTPKAGGSTRATRMAAAAAAAANNGAAAAAPAGGRRLLSAMPTQPPSSFNWRELSNMGASVLNTFRSALPSSPRLSSSLSSITTSTVAAPQSLSARHPHVLRGVDGIRLRDDEKHHTYEDDVTRRAAWDRMVRVGHTLELDRVPELPIPADRIQEWRQRERQGLGRGVNAAALGVVVEGIPTTAIVNAVDDDAAVPITTVRRSHEWNRDDRQLADRIANSKAKELLRLQREWADNLLARAVESRQAELFASGSHEPVWPWELIANNDDHSAEAKAPAPTTGWTMSPDFDWSMELGRAHDLLLAGDAHNGPRKGLAELLDENDGLLGHDMDGDERGPDAWRQALRTAIDLQFPHHQDAADAFDTSIAQNIARIKATGGRRLLDFYGDSLRFVNQLFTKEFGRDSRKAPAHMPHMIDVNVMTELQSRWPEQYDATSSHRFRHSRDMQFAFAYFYYLMNAHQTFDEDKFFDESLDLDRDGYLDEKEIRYMALLLNHGRRVDEDDIIRLHNTLYNASVAIGQPGLVSLPALEYCKPIMAKLEKLVTSKKKYRHEQMGLEQVEFYMVGNNATVVQKRLDEIRAKGPKFVCLNDDMNKTHAPPQELLDALADFYDSYFPKASPFELPDGVMNPPGLYIDELRALYQPSIVTRVITQSPLVLVLIIAAVLACLCLVPGNGGNNGNTNGNGGTSAAAAAVEQRRQMVMV